MKKVVDINSKRNGYVKFTHKEGWERGNQTQGKWNGFYECMGLLPSSEVTCYSKGNFEMGKRVGNWECIYIFHDRNKPMEIHYGKYKNGKRDGNWKIHEHGKRQEIYLYEQGKMLKE